MDAIVGESYVSRTAADRSSALLDAADGNRNARGRRAKAPASQPETTYGVGSTQQTHVIDYI